MKMGVDSYFHRRISMYYPRTETKTLQKMAEDFPCIILYGPRQCGKSTMIRFSFEKSLDYTTLTGIGEEQCQTVFGFASMAMCHR